MKYLVLIGRLIFGGWFVVNGLNHWFNFFPQPMGQTHLGNELVVALLHSHLFDVVKGIEAVAGVMILANRFTPLALNACLPISVVIFYWNVVLEGQPAGWIAGCLTLGINALLMLAYFPSYRSVLAWKAPLAGEAA